MFIPGVAAIQAAEPVESGTGMAPRPSAARNAWLQQATARLSEILRERAPTSNLYSLPLTVSFSPTGRIERLRIHSGSAKLDQQLTTALTGLEMGAPPRYMPLVITFRIRATPHFAK